MKTGLNLLSLTEKNSNGTSSEFGYAAGVGYSLTMDSTSTDVSVKFQTYASSISTIDLGVAYKFGL